MNVNLNLFIICEIVKKINIIHLGDSGRKNQTRQVMAMREETAA